MPSGQPGELWCKTPTMMRGYWGKPEETAKVITADGWFKTGDIAFADENGKYVIIDRKKVCLCVGIPQRGPLTRHLGIDQGERQSSCPS